MHKDLSVNYKMLIDHLQWLLQNGNDGICLLGTTGEANSLTVEERMDVIGRVAEGGIDPVKLLIGTGCCAYPDTVKLTKYAVEKGAGGILMLPPFYYKNLSEDGILKYFRLIIDEINNKDLRIYLYHFPKMTGVHYTISLVKKLISEHPGIVVGMKDSSGDWENMELFCKEIPGFNIYAGTEKYLLPTLRAGGAGCISASTNVTMTLAAEIYNKWQTRKVDDLQDFLSNVRSSLEITSFVSGLKYIFSKWKNDPEWLHMRPPNVLPDQRKRKQLENSLKELHSGYVPGAT
jgi:4-hydroxy-tetrahydrodipicolinate synthase